MAGSLQLLSSVLYRGTFALSRCRFSSKGSHIQPWARAQAVRRRDDISNGEHELEDVEDKIQQVIDKEVKRQKQVKFHILRRQMTPRGPPERKLTWDAMEEIRHLKQTQPEEWTVERLAEGFSVSKDVIFRVLRSKFVPNPERKAKQDTKVMLKLKQQVLPSGPREELDKERLIPASSRAALSSGSQNIAVIPIEQKSLSQTEPSPAALSIVTKNPSLDITARSAERTYEVIKPSIESTEAEEEEDDEDEYWDGQVLLEEDIEELITVKATPVVKEGEEFFDIHGNFLYRI